MLSSYLWRRLSGAALVGLLAGQGALAAAALPMRLEGGARPLSYDLELRIDPDRAQHSGTVAIELQLDQPLQSLRLHARELRVEAARAQPEKGAAVAARVERADADSIRLHFARALPAGRARLSLRFRGELSDKRVFGLFRQREGGAWYAYSQFEDVGARRAFPLFDEPGYKQPWRLALTVPQGQQAFANMPVQSERPAGRGWKRLQFKESPPMPGYLLALAVGPFDVREGAPAGRTALRYLAPKGRAAEAAYAAEVTPATIAALQDYFGMPYPFAKLDSAAIPLTDWFGAMENPGLITYASRLLLAPPGEESRRFQRSYLAVAAHELAHQWFGNYVTMAWWDDLWLNESFASWMGDKIVAQLRPEWRWESKSQEARRDAMHGDRLPSARRVHQPVEQPEDLGTAFDEITYSKGQSVLTMFEAWLGPERMRSGVRRYMARHAWGNASSADFLAALAAEGDVQLPAAFASFIDQPGIPQLHFALSCEGKPRLTITQHRYQPLGATAVAAQRWLVPVLLRTPGGESRALLAGDQVSVELPDAQCPAWLQPNVGGHGYYRSQLDAALLQRFVREGRPSVNELLALLDDQLALAQSGDVSLADALALLGRLAADERREPVEAAAKALAELQPLTSAAQRPAYARLWQQLFGKLGHRLSWQPRVGESEDQALLREALLPLLAEQGEDVALRAQARGITARWLAVAGRDGQAHAELMAPGLRQALLRSAAFDGDATLFEGFLALARRTPERRLREDLMEALAAFNTPTLAERARALSLDAQIDIRELLPHVLEQQSRQPALAEAVLDFVVRNDVALRRRSAEQAAASWPRWLAEGGCSLARAEALQRHFAAQSVRHESGPGQLAKAGERLRLCAAYREAQADALAQALDSLTLVASPVR